MAAGVYNMTIEQGADYVLPVVVQTGTPAAPRDLTGYTARMQIRAKVTDAAPLISLTSSPAAGIVITPASGLITITITAAQSSAVTAKSGVYDLELVSSAGVVERVLKGKVKFSPEVTR